MFPLYLYFLGGQLLSFLRDTFSKLITKWEFLLATKFLKALGYSNISADVADKSIIFSFDKDRVAILNMDHHMLGYSIEATVVFSADILSLKTLSDMDNLIFMYRCSGSGVRPASEGRVRLNISYYIGDNLSIRGITLGMTYLIKCLATLELYLTERIRRADKDMYDLSMFEDVNLTGFNPQDMGERKEFIFGSWDAYAGAVKKEYEGFPNHPHAIDLLAKIEACRAFEDKNQIPVSELGPILLDDIILNRQLSEVSKTAYGVN
jgi:hypothetical protein